MTSSEPICILPTTIFNTWDLRTSRPIHAKAINFRKQQKIWRDLLAFSGSLTRPQTWIGFRIYTVTNLEAYDWHEDWR
jgi:hypothetical protein